MPPITIMIKPVSGRCNMICDYCFYRDEMANRTEALRDRMDQAGLEMLIKRAFLFADEKVNFVFQGGEPSLAGAEFYRRFLELEKRYNVRNLSVLHVLQTNGLELDDSLLRVLQQGRFMVGVSLDGTEFIHDERRRDIRGNGTYDRIKKNLHRLKEWKIDFNILCVVDDRIANVPEEVFEALKEFHYLQFIPCLAPLDDQKAWLHPKTYGRFLTGLFRCYKKAFLDGQFVSIRLFDNWLNMLAGYAPEMCGLQGFCSAGIVVEGDGSVYPCDFYALDEWKLGNIFQDSVLRMMKSENAARFHLQSLTRPEKCAECKWASLCRGGCRRDWVFRGEQPTHNKLCEGYEYFFENCYQDMMELAKRPAPKPV